MSENIVDLDFSNTNSLYAHYPIGWIGVNGQILLCIIIDREVGLGQYGKTVIDIVHIGTPNVIILIEDIHKGIVTHLFGTFWDAKIAT